MSIWIARVLIVCVAVASGFPLLAPASLLFSFLLMGGGLLQAMNGELFEGIAVFFIFICAFYGVFALSNLVIHFLRTPFQNPAKNTALKYGAGLICGWAAMIAILSGVVRRAEEASIGAFFLLPVAVVVSLFWLINKVSRPSR